MTRYPGTRINRPEGELQRRQVQYLRVLEGQNRLRFAHVPNGGKRGKTEAAIFKGLGVSAGFPDMILTLPDGKVAFIENKAEKGSTTQAQKEWAGWLTSNGHRYAVVRSFDQFLQALYTWGVISAREAQGIVSIPHKGVVS